MMNDPNHIHVYLMRHIFRGDDLIGVYDTTTNHAKLVESAREHAQHVKAHFMRRYGRPVKILIGNEEAARIAPLPEFPPEIIAEMDPYLGDRTPAAIEHARRHHTREEFARRYGSDMEYSACPGELTEAPSAQHAEQSDSPKRGRGRPKKDQP